MNSFESLLEKLVEMEMAMGGLYHLFSERFPEAAVFWQEMSTEEEEHSKWIEETLDVFRKGQVKRGTTTLTSQAADIVIKHVSSLGEKCKRREISIVSAYASAYDLENSLLEKNFFRVFNLDLPPHKEVGDKLFHATQAHRKRIGEALNTIRSRGKVSAQTITP